MSIHACNEKIELHIGWLGVVINFKLDNYRQYIFPTFSVTIWSKDILNFRIGEVSLFLNKKENINIYIKKKE